MPSQGRGLSRGVGGETSQNASLTGEDDGPAGGARWRSGAPSDRCGRAALNLQRAAQAAIDLAAHVVATEGFGLPSDHADTVTLIEKQAVIDAAMAQRMRRMVGFRNIAVHQYQALDPAIVEAIVTRHLDDLRAFAATIVERFVEPPQQS
jgi:uncharacterized protein YutE (UPF0331/DUF86 family)